MFSKFKTLSLGLCLASLLCAAFILMSATAPLAAKGDLQSVEKAGSARPMKITLGKADVVDVGGDVSDVMVANPDIIDVTAVQSSKLYVVGVQVGDTNIIALDEMGNVVKRMDVHVAYDTEAIQGLIHDLFPEENVTVGSIHDQILLTGTVSNPSAAARITSIVGHYVSDLQDEDKPIDELVANQLEVRGEQQVMMQVRILEAQRTVLKELGLQTDINDIDDLSATDLFTFQPPLNQGGRSSLTAFGGSGLGLSQDPVAVFREVLGTGIAGIGQIGLTLQALEERDLINVLAEPNLTAVSGQSAGFLAGGEFPVPVGRDQIGNIVIEFKKFGVSLNFKPVVLSDKRISLQLNTEVSSLDFTAPISTSDLIIPGLKVRRADTTVEISSGGSLMIAGLMQSEALRGMNGLPGISSTPILGDLMSSKSFERNETELVVLVTPYLVEPYAEKERATPVPAQETDPMSNSFAANIRRVYKVEDPELFNVDGQYGYLLD